MTSKALSFLCGAALIAIGPRVQGFEIEQYIESIQANAPVRLSVQVCSEASVYGVYVYEAETGRRLWSEFLDSEGAQLSHSGGIEAFSGGFDVAAYVSEVCGSYSPDPGRGACVNATWRWDAGAYLVKFFESSDYGSLLLYSERITYSGEKIGFEFFNETSRSDAEVVPSIDVFEDQSSNEWLAELGSDLAQMDAFADEAFSSALPSSWEDEPADVSGGPWMEFALAEEGSTEQFAAGMEALRQTFDLAFFGWFSTQVGGPESGRRSSPSKGVFSGSTVGMTKAERSFAAEMLALGVNVERIIATGTGKSADFRLNGVLTEHKVVTRAGVNTLKNAIERAAEQSKSIVIDARSAGVSSESAKAEIQRALGNMRDFQGTITVRTSNGSVTYPF